MIAKKGETYGEIHSRAVYATDSEGRFDIRGIPSLGHEPSMYTLLVSESRQWGPSHRYGEDADYVFTKVDAPVRQGGITNLVVGLSIGGSAGLEGQIRLVPEVPILESPLSLSLTRNPYDHVEGVTYYRLTDAHGNFLIRDLVEGHYAISVSHTFSDGVRTHDLQIHRYRAVFLLGEELDIHGLVEFRREITTGSLEIRLEILGASPPRTFFRIDIQQISEQDPDATYHTGLIEFELADTGAVQGGETFRLPHIPVGRYEIPWDDPAIECEPSSFVIQAGEPTTVTMRYLSDFEPLEEDP